MSTHADLGQPPQGDLVRQALARERFERLGEGRATSRSTSRYVPDDEQRHLPGVLGHMLQ